MTMRDRLKEALRNADEDIEAMAQNSTGDVLADAVIACLIEPDEAMKAAMEEAYGRDDANWTDIFGAAINTLRERTE